MKNPKMILFDYGQTLINEDRFDSLAGNETVIASARTNPCHVDAQMRAAYEQAEPEGISYRRIGNWSELRELIKRV